jgi:hypothetical protein
LSRVISARERERKGKKKKDEIETNVFVGRQWQQERKEKTEKPGTADAR